MFRLTVYATLRLQIIKNIFTYYMYNKITPSGNIKTELNMLHRERNDVIKCVSILISTYFRREIATDIRRGYTIPSYLKNYAS
jgi:hypothetical protein